MPVDHSADGDPLDSPRRLADLDASTLLEATSIAALDALTQVASLSIGAGSTALVNAITADRQITVSLAVEGENRRSGTEIPLSRSLCTYVVVSGRPYVVSHVGSGAYAGFPVHGRRGTVIGSMCAITPRPRLWSPQDLRILQSVTTAAESVVTMTGAARRARTDRASGAVPTDPAARVQHDLRTPLTSLVGYLDLVLDGTLGEVNPAQAAALRRCEASAARLREAVEALL